MLSFDRKTIKDVDWSIYKKVLLRLDLNVPVKDGVIVDNNRIVQALSTIKFLLSKNLKIIILSHFSRIKDISDIKSGKKSLLVVSEEIKKLLPDSKILFISSLDHSEIKEKIETNSSIDIFVLENTRYYDVNESNEVVKLESKNSLELAKFWASLGDFYVNDAFGTSHRSHASNVGLAELLPSAVGLLVEKEIQYLSKSMLSKESPKVLILGGSKVSDKLKLIKFVISKVDSLLIGGGMAYTFLKSQGKFVGNSLVEEEMISECKELLQKYSNKLFLPLDHVVSPEFKDVPGVLRDASESGWSGMALDIGPKTISSYSKILDSAKVVIWNGPMGVFEFENFGTGTKEIAKKLSEITKRGAYTVIGGGDSAAAADKFGLSEEMSFISTGGGASLTFFEGSPMPGIECISAK